MVDSSKPDNDALRWRDKYFTLSEEQEKIEQDYASYLGVLQRALVRISLAADGQDSELDSHLATLRAMLRKDPVNQASIGANLTQVEAAILRLDKQRKDGGQRGEKSLLQLVEQLQQLNLSRDKQRALKRYSKSLRVRAEQLNAYPELLDEYSRLQRDALAESFSASAESPAGTTNKGLFSRIFGGDTEAVEAGGKSLGHARDEHAEGRTLVVGGTHESTVVAENIALTSERDASLKPEADTPAGGMAVSVESVEGERTSTGGEIAGESDKGEVDSTQPGGEVAREQADNLEPVIAVLADLLEQLPLSPDERGQAEQLRDQLAARVEAGGLGGVVDGAAELVLAALEKSQQEFEQFLLMLDKQLIGINDFLDTQAQGGSTRNDSSQQLNAVILGQVSNISKAVNSAEDIDNLKASVQSQLNSIAGSVDDFVVAENQREQALEDQLQAMRGQLETVQSEARVIRNKLHNETLRALTDVLTGLPNREAFNERYSMERERYLRYKNPAVLAILDIDHFKQVNDQHGHLVGDRVLQYVARKLKETVRNTDFLARYGGEEFVLILPETTLDAAGLAFEKIRKAVADMSLDAVGSVTASAGVAAFQLGEKAEQLVERADKALYKAKEKGRNRVEVAPG